MSVLPPASSYYTTSVPLLSTRRYRPRCALAEIMVARIQQQKLTPGQIVQAMGYPRQHTIAAKDRLDHVLRHATLGLDGSFLDAYYDAHGFVVALCQVLEIPADQYQPLLQHISS
ncbi:hypothetical protein [Psychrobacter sp. FDAARGOS_221]|uniref:hypothetical protein n=1 Tax=Psychrobacter sp. FDAARGOS_221 TaxID=1975705 RepID=UPI000BB596E8|nr:hypothetical protein [Psychrobacter sp. FDAARGOS_221]PNK60196.1 hypothetical protein A6J60_004465 [Psychrobacter sp. FDAARGOS_221]